MSTCPLCRARFNVCPSVCKKLHFLLEKICSKQIQERQEVILEEEKTTGFFSPPLHSETSSSSDSDLSSCLRCENCHKIPASPLIPTCGHILCIRCCNTSQKCPLPTCQLKFAYFPEVFRPLQEYLQSEFPDLWEAANTEEQNEVPSLAKPDVLDVLDERFKVQGPGVNLSTDGDKVKIEIDPETFVHYAYGCDGCGMFPLRGRRYRCLDCPEKMGYDLCKECYSSELRFSGKFNQNHTIDHRMKEAPMKATQIHLLQAWNPELPYSKLMSYLGDFEE